MKVPIKIKKLHPDAIIPSYAHPGDSGMDLCSIEELIIPPGERRTVHTGISMEYPEGFCTLFWDKSGLAGKSGITILAGVFEPTYKGEYLVVMLNTSKEPHIVKKGQKITQVLVQPICTAEIQEVQELSDSTRGANGFGSTGQ